ncbi:cytochrome P450 [Cynara cardunculus var. scolymus]|uniref:Cytochrome P450 n=1 Tax=Cynara cardunculus var. scolymus TaxID=59895 RepID=A0A103XIA9_CYNCS|nr:cytochrome P450 [Cynara cardunculus var. scolymus]
MNTLHIIFASAATTLLLIIITFSALLLRIFVGKSVKNPNYPPILGTVFGQLFYFNTLHDYFADFALKHPTFRLLAPDQSELYTTDVRNIEHVLKTNFGNYSKGEYNKDIVTDLFGNGIFAVDGVKWKQQRKLASFEFSTRVLRDFSFGFGVELNCLEGSSEEGGAFIKAFDNSNALIYWRYVDPLWKLKRFLNVGCEAALRDNIKSINDFVLDLISKRREQLEKNQHCNPQVQEKVVLEMETIMGNEGNGARIEDFVEKITDEVLDKMHYLHAALSETLRLYPAVPLASPKFTSLFVAGPRICLGKDFAYRQMKIVSIALLRFFVFKLADESRKVTYRTMFTLHIDGGLHLLAENGAIAQKSCAVQAYQYLSSFHIYTHVFKQLEEHITTSAMATSMDFLSSSGSIPVITVISLLLLLLYIYNQQQQWKTKKKHHPIAGTMLNQLINFHRLHDYMTDLARKYRTYRLITPFRNEVYTSDPANVEYILKTNFENYGKGMYTHNILKDLLGDGIFTVDGDKWRQQRKVSSYEFSTKVLRDFSSVIFRKNAVKLAPTLDSIFKVAFGIDLDSMCGSNEEGVRFSNAFDDASAMTLKRYVDVTWKIKKFLNIGSEARFLQINDTDPKYLRDIILNFIIAGKDTTSATMSWFIYMLCKHPQIQLKVAQEIKEATNKKEGVTDVADFAVMVTEEALEKMHYLHAALTETLRLFPAVPVDAKICCADDVLPDGYDVKGGDMMSYQPYAMGRMKFIWGDDAEDFKPERWIDENGCFRPESPFKFTTFQAGQRICLGREFAYRQMKIFASVLLGCFVFKLSDENKTANYKTMLNLHIDGGLHVRVFNKRG